jgi:hypothetical protein
MHRWPELLPSRACKVSKLSCNFVPSLHCSLEFYLTLPTLSLSFLGANIRVCAYPFPICPIGILAKPQII